MKTNINELNCIIENTKKINDQDFFIIKSIEDSLEHIIPVEHLLPFNVKVGQTYTFKKDFNKKNKKVYLRLKQEPKYFKIIGFDKISYNDQTDRDAFLIEDENKNVVKVAFHSWQKKEDWNHKSLLCEIERYDSNGHQVLVNRDNRHPIYVIDGEYKFRILTSKKKTLNNKEYLYFDLLGEDGCKHEVNMLPGQSLNFNSIDVITCKVKDIAHRIKLLQVNIKDPFFTTVDKIVSNKNLISKYFNPIITTKIIGDKDLVHLLQQYESESAFWVFTFTNKVLLKKFKDEIRKNNYSVAKEINELIITFERWIIKKGIITSIPDEKRKESTLIKAKKQLQSAILIENALEELIKNEYTLFEKNDLLEDSEEPIIKLYYLISFINPELVNEKCLIEILIKALKKVDIGADQYYLNKLFELLSRRKNNFIIEKEELFFNLTSVYLSEKNLENNQRKYFYWSYAELLVGAKLNKVEQVNLRTGQLLRRFLKTEEEIENKLTLLINSYFHFDLTSNPINELPFIFQNDQLTVNFNKLIKLDYFNNNDPNSWPVIEETFNNNSTLIVNLKNKTKSGYEVEFNGIKGFLPNHLISDKLLKNYPFEECDFSLSTKCLVICSFFKFFIVGQIQPSEPDYYFCNNFSFKNDAVYEGIVKQVLNYGCFISTPSGEGLLHVSNIFDFPWDQKCIHDYFKKGDKVKVVATEFHDNGKVGFSISRFQEIDQVYYQNFIEGIFSKEIVSIEDIDDIYNSDEAIDSIYVAIQKEKALCFEQLAVIQKNIEDKINSFKLAKQFYINTNNARSYLANIYTSYFEILLKIEDCLNKQTLKGIKQIKQDAAAIKLGVNDKTIETFPDSEKLIFFLEIISLFNETGDDSLQMLYDYTISYSKDSNKGALKTIAKITMANNLLASETKEENDFSLKNLRLIYDYISNGVLSLSETIEDKHEREIKAEILYWKERIKADESETLEFKSSFFTPILDEERLRKLEFLKKAEKKTEVIKREIDRINGELAKKAVIHSSLKTLVAFANTSGGTLLLGVNDNKRILGLENEYSTFSKKSDQNRDGFGKYFDNIVKDYLGDSFSSLMSRKFLKFPEGDILIISVKPSIHEVFLLKDEEGNYSEQLYIRNLSSSKALWGIELSKFIKNKHTIQLESKITPIGDF